LVVIGTEGSHAQYRVTAIAVGYRDGRHAGYGLQAGAVGRVDRLHVHDALLERGARFGLGERSPACHGRHFGRFWS
jgi:hypothetical protein